MTGRPPDEQPPPPVRLLATSVGLGSRVWDGFKAMATLSDSVRRLEEGNRRIQAAMVALGRDMVELAKDVHDLAGQMKGIEKRLEDKDRLVEATVKLRIMEELQKLRSDFAARTGDTAGSP